MTRRAQCSLEPPVPASQSARLIVLDGIFVVHFVGLPFCCAAEWPPCHPATPGIGICLWGWRGVGGIPVASPKSGGGRLFGGSHSGALPGGTRALAGTRGAGRAGPSSGLATPRGFFFQRDQNGPGTLRRPPSRHPPLAPRATCPHPALAPTAKGCLRQAAQRQHHRIAPPPSRAPLLIP